MSKRQEIRERRHREQIRNRIIVIGLVVLGALLVTFALILPSLKTARTAANAAATPVVVVTPRAFTTKVDGVHLGDPNAPVKVDAYEDFRCSVCLLYTQSIEPVVIQNYVETGKVYYTYHFFIVIDGNDGTDASLRSANAALCAGEQGHFWDYHDTLYANQITEDASLYTDARLITMAENLKLDMTAFNQCYQAKKYNSVVQADITQGVTLKITGTPSIFVNGKIVSNFQQTTQTIDAALAGK
ncbi:MAG: thioredoxin domain-containing protein [Anaerolineales bacterium]|jgi:protein-disulfide isomerase